MTGGVVKLPTILLVEDNPHIMKINAQLLSMQGYAVLKAATAEEARNRLKEKQADLIVLDVMLPDGGGLELCRELKTRYPVPVLFLTALGASRDIVDGFRAGGDYYLVKPYDLEVLLSKIRALLPATQKEEG